MHFYLTIAFILAVIASLIAVWLFWIRPILKLTPRFAALYQREENFFAAVKIKLAGIKQKLATAFLTVAGFVVLVYDNVAPYATGVDLTPITSQVPAPAWPLIVIAVAWLLNWFRKLSETRPAA